MKYDKEYHVRTTGNDANAGTQAAPLLTIQEALSRCLLNTKVKIDVGSGTFTETIDVSTYDPFFAHVVNKQDTIINISQLYEGSPKILFSNGSININGGWA